MKKILIISIGVVIALGVLLFVFFELVIAPNAQTPVYNPVGGSNTNTSSDATTTPNLNMLSISTTGGGTIQVKNFKADPSVTEDPVNPGYYYFGYHFNEGVPDSTATNTPPYVIQYTDSNQSFSIVLWQEPISSTRKDAEQYLMAHLGISQSDMCQIKSMITVPGHVDATYAGTNLGFSFCPGAVQLP